MSMQELSRPDTPGASPEVFQRLGNLTRELHDTLSCLGVMPSLQESAESLPDARSRLTYIAQKTGEAADKVLTAVEHAKHEHENILATTRRITTTLAAANPLVHDQAALEGQVPVPRAVMEQVAELEQAAWRIDGHLTDIMLAQDFHDLTGQVVKKVVALAINLEENLVKLLVQASGDNAPVLQQRTLTDANGLQGPVVDAEREGVVTDQGEVDDLLASMGF